MSRKMVNVIDGVFIGGLLGAVYAVFQAWRPSAFIPPSDVGFFLTVTAVAAAISGGIVGLFIQIRETFLGGAMTAMVWTSFLTLVQVGFGETVDLDLDYTALMGQMLIGLSGTALLGIAINLIYTWSARRLWPLNEEPE